MITPEDIKAGQRFVNKGLVGELYFSGGTYQVRVDDPEQEEPMWAFLQLDDQGEALDCFCSCKAFDIAPSCPHLAAATIVIFNGHPDPLHCRFRDSFWHCIFEDACGRFGDRTDCLSKVSPSTYEAGQGAVSIVCKTKTAKEKLQQWVDQRVRETEETSLKFSNLSAEEIALWREGRPNRELRYELSFWSDLAKWCMELQESGEGYTLGFEIEGDQLPQAVVWEFKDIKGRWEIPLELWNSLILTLNSVVSPLSVQQWDRDSIDSVTYDPEAVCLQVHFKETPQQLKKQHKKSIEVGKWLYIPKKGFVSRHQGRLFLQPHIEKQRIGETIDRYPQLLTRLLKGTKLHTNAIPLNHSLSFDAQWNLHIDAYLRNVGDLSQGRNQLFGRWVYIDPEGFYPIKDPLASMASVIVPDLEVGDFVTRQRIFFNQQEGFHTHIAAFSSRLEFKVDHEETLLFFSRADEEGLRTRDFGDWIYVEGLGFYAKLMGRRDSGIYGGLRVPAQSVAAFIQTHYDDLQSIEGFFASVSPIVSVGVTIRLGRRDSIVVTPHYKYRAGIDPEQLLFYDAYVYQKGGGFSTLPTDLRLPAAFRRVRTIERDQIAHFLEHELPYLRAFAHEIDPGLEIPTQVTLQVDAIASDQPGKMRLRLYYATEWGRVSVEEIWKAMQSRHNYLFSKAGFFDLHARRMNWVRHLQGAAFQGDEINLSTWELLRLHTLETIDGPKQQEAAHLFARVMNMEPLPLPSLRALKCQLRSYQEVGVQWLWYLYTFGLSGLLCDDMGLGKTHQTMGLMAAVMANAPKGARFLIVCPTSVIYHWEDKLNHFLPGVKVTHFHGSKRNMQLFEKKGGVLLTSYGVLRAEQESLKPYAFEVAIFDEAQVAKNHKSKTYHALTQIHAAMRLGLTGTPIENHIGELKALFDLILPGYFPSEAQFREQFLAPIERDGDLQAKGQLARLVKPFILRRKKAEVLQELPEKVEEVSYCDLSEKQAEMYRNAIAMAQASVIDVLQKGETPIPYLSVFQLMMTLKQICDHPAVALKEPQNYRHYSSGKWLLFLELLEEARSSEQKVVVFSHYLAMLDIIESHLKEHKIGYASIRGATQNRKEELERFQTDPQCEVFVASLQAAGLGVDLTAASVVIHYDRWWNAARENQATDRVHRIGQVRGVQVFKLLTKHTIEERINELIEEKAELLEEIVSTDKAGELKRFNRDELLALFHFEQK